MACGNIFPAFQSCLMDTPLWVKLLCLLIVGLVAVGVVYRRWWKTRPRRTPWTRDWEKGMVYLYQFPRTAAVPCLSPFCLKLETFLRIADIPYKNVEDIPYMTFRSREGTLPFVELDGVEYPDSDLAIHHLTHLLDKQQIEAHMSDVQKAEARGLEALVEASILPGSAWFRLPYAKQIFQLFPPGSIPKMMIPLVAKSWRKEVTKKIRLIGIGKHSEADICKLTEWDLKALSDYLGTKHYFTGFRATKLDATVFSVVGQILYMPFDTPQRTFIDANCPNLRAHCDRIKDTYWPDWDECTANYRMDTDWKAPKFHHQ